MSILQYAYQLGHAPSELFRTTSKAESLRNSDVTVCSSLATRFENNSPVNSYVCVCASTGERRAVWWRFFSKGAIAKIASRRVLLCCLHVSQAGGRRSVRFGSDHSFERRRGRLRNLRGLRVSDTNVGLTQGTRCFHTCSFIHRQDNDATVAMIVQVECDFAGKI